MDNTDEMGETFLININCSKILPDSEAVHYTMLIDGSKMSIVYELVEWVRWMFSVDDCFYLTHENSVIHELEDIQMLAKLKHFEITPCGQPHCAHKKIYRDLLDKLNLTISWNELKIHKYFLDKMNEMSCKLSRGCNRKHDLRRSTKYSTNEEKLQEKYQNTQESHLKPHNSTDTSKKLNLEADKMSEASEDEWSETNSLDQPCQKLTSKIGDSWKSGKRGESPSKANSFLGKIRSEKDNFFYQLDKNFTLSHMSNNSVNKDSEFKKPNPTNFNTSGKDVFKIELKTGQGKEKNLSKSRITHKYIRPFSLGEIITNLKADFDKKCGQALPKGNVSQDSTSMAEKGNSNKEVTAFENELLMQDKTLGDRKRQRTRKRKRSKKQSSEDDGFVSYELEKKKGLCSLGIPKSNSQTRPTRPNHIRFDVNDEDYAGESESIEGYNENEFENITKETGSSNSADFLKNEPEALLSVLNGENQNPTQKSVQVSPERNSANHMVCSPLSNNQIMEEQNLIDLPNGVCENAKQSSGSPENLELSGCNEDFNDLLSLREKFKKGIVIQRYY